MPVPPKVSVATDRGLDREQRECSQGKCDRCPGDANNGNGRTALTPCAVVPRVDRKHIPRAATRTRMPTSAHGEAMQQSSGSRTLVRQSSGVGELNPQLGLGQRRGQRGALNNTQSTILGLDRSESQQLRSTDYVAIQADDTTDASIETQSVLVFRYIDSNSKVVERFYCFSYLKDSSADTISAAIPNKLNFILPERSGKEKLIAQSYDGTSVMRGASDGVKKKSEIYNLMHIMSTATSTN
ncbi:hypothetical protein NDU88_001477 [Pleurodeles waltl]|uniref:Uncharacterized protein n=1 Tax=Pleurodeles waltl TaxID=8319 RepID=A0AAV7SA69_PLEWA|nr:hypothetical protein NDU88_001477 [Pleurodeles waltl]